MADKKRLDQLTHERYPHYSRTLIQSLIMQGKVLVNGAPVTKPGQKIADDAQVEITAQEQKYVSRAGVKLEHALDHYQIDVSGLVVLDAGLSTGGFSDCLLQRGAAKIYGIDVGHAQVHEKIKNDLRMVIMERTNLRTLTKLPELIDLATLDLSFISVLAVMPAVVPLLKPHAALVVLIKPQFEAGREHVGRGGIVSDEKVHKQVIERVVTGIEAYGFSCFPVIASPITGASGNKEFLVYCQRIA